MIQLLIRLASGAVDCQVRQAGLIDKEKAARMAAESNARALDIKSLPRHPGRLFRNRREALIRREAVA